MQQKLNQVNQFSGGMIKDLHPIMMSNTALTDCLNGTLITFNGNEFALQNDMGNYAFKYGSLSNGFVPVGIKEFGGILYIISYNPISNKVEVGSFPSQKTIFNAIDSGAQSNFEPLELEEDVNLYSELVAKSIIKIFSKEDTFFLNPGDKYYISIKDNSGEWEESWESLNELLLWQHLTPYILTNENKLYSIEGYIKIAAKTDVINKDAYSTVTWEIPGWIAAKFDVNVMQEFNVYSDSNTSKIIKEGEKYYSIPSSKYKIQSIWNLNNYPDNLGNYLEENLFYVIHSESNLKNITKAYIEEYIKEYIKEPEKTKKVLNKTTYNDFQTVYYSDYDFEDYIKLGESKYVVPVLRVNVGKTENGEDIYKYIVYNQFNTEINTNRAEIDRETISIGDDTFKYTVSENSFVLTYNVNSYPGIKLKMNFKRPFADEDLTAYNENLQSLDGESKPVYKNSIIVDDLNYHGINIKSFPFTTWEEYQIYKYKREGENPYETVEYNTSKTKDRYGIEHNSGEIVVSNTFDKEDYYELEATFYFELENGNIETIKSQSFNIIISEVVNNWYNSVNRYQERDYSDVINSLMDSITIKNTPTLVPTESDIRGYSQITGNYFSIDKGSEESDIKMLENLLAETSQNETWIRENFGDPFVDMGYTENKSGKVFIYDGTDFELFNKGKIDIKLPLNQYKGIGRLWRFLNPTDIKDSKIIDSRKVPYNVEISGDKNGDYYTNNNNLSLQFYMKNDIEMTLSSRSIVKSIPESTKSILSYLKNEWDSRHWAGMKEGEYGWVKGEIGVRKLSSGDGIGFGFYECSKYILYKFDNGNLYVTKQSSYNEPPANSWVLVTFNNVISLSDLDSVGDIIHSNTGNKGWYPWIGNDHTPKKSDQRWAYYTAEAQDFAPIMFPLLLYNGSSNHSRIKSELHNTFIEQNKRYTALYLPGKIPYIIYPSGSPVSSSTNPRVALAQAKSQAFYTFFAMMWYCKVGLGVKRSTTYYPTVTTSYSKTNPKLFKGINLEMKFEYNYSIKNSFTGLNSLNDYEDYFTIPINKELSTPENEEVYTIIQSFAFNTSEKSAAALLAKQLEPEVTKSGVLVLDPSASKCEEVDLSEIIKDWNINSSSLTYEEEIDDNRVRIRSGDNWYIPVAKESPKITTK